MNVKTIKSYLSNRHSTWLKSIKDTELRKEVRSHSLIAGGAIVSLLQGETPNDTDIYLTDPEIALKLAVYYVNEWNEDNKHQSQIGIRVKVKDEKTLENWSTEQVLASYTDYLEQHGEKSDSESDSDYRSKEDMINYLCSMGGYGIAYEPDLLKQLKVEDLYRLNKFSNGVSLFIRSSGVAKEEEVRDDGQPESATAPADQEQPETDKEQSEDKFLPVYMTDNAISLSGDVQVILRFIGEPTEITKNFDYVHCTCTYFPWKKELFLPSEALASILTKELKYVGSRYPICSLFRMRKFLNRGYHLDAGQILKMVFQITELILEDLDVLEDQLIGVDSVYMSALVEAIKKANREKKDITPTYLITLVEDLFDTPISN